jgi:hypothetical protein
LFWSFYWCKYQTPGKCRRPEVMHMVQLHLSITDNQFIDTRASSASSLEH